MSTQVPNLEEAANVAAEFIYNIDNLPHEVSHILQEIKHRETRTQELQQEIDKDTSKYIRNARRASGTPPSPSSSRAPSPKLLSIPAKVAASYAEIQELAQEKCLLANRLIEIITRTRAKLDIDIVKVRTLQGDSPEVIAAAAAAAAAKPLAGLAGISSESFGAPGRNPALAISESLRNALTIPTTPDPRATTVQAAASPSPAPPPSKKRRITSSIKISPASTPTKHRSASPTTSAPPASAHVQTKSRLSRQVHIPVEEETPEPEAEPEGEASDYLEMEEEAEDERLYCFCQKQSYGDMIACDNEPSCPYEWFHLTCVGVKQPVPKVWYCDVCLKNKATTAQPASSTRKGRKK